MSTSSVLPSEPSVVFDQQHDVFVRSGTHDLKSALEVRRLVRDLDVDAQDLVLDVGAHIGAFSRLCAKRGARVISVEPEPQNIAVLRQNISLVGTVPAIWEVALTDDPGLLLAGHATLHLKGLTHTGLHTLVQTPRPKGTITVPVASFSEAVREYQPTVLKVDIEGGEWMCDFSNLPASVRKLHVEMHMIPAQAGGRERAPLLHASFLEQGFEVVKAPNFNVMWGTHPIYRRTSGGL